MSVLGGNSILGSSGGGAVPGISGTGQTDGDASTLWDTLEFGVKLGSQPTTALIGGVKSVNADGVTPLSTAGANSISILAGATDADHLARGDRAVAIGYDAEASLEGNIGIGDAVRSIGLGTTAIGDGAKAQSGKATSYGYNANAQGTDATAIGDDSRTNGVHGFSGGSHAFSSGTGSVGLGGDNVTGASASANGAIAIGGDDGFNTAANASSSKAVAIGVGSIASATNAWQFGAGTNSTANSYQYNMTTLDLRYEDAGTAGATESAWIQVDVGGTAGYIRVYSTV